MVGCFGDLAIEGYTEELQETILSEDYELDKPSGQINSTPHSLTHFGYAFQNDGVDRLQEGIVDEETCFAMKCLRLMD